MDIETQGSTKIVGNFNNFCQDSCKMNYGIVLANPVFLNSQENASPGRESQSLQAERVGDQESNDGKRIRVPIDERTSGNSSKSVVIEKMMVTNCGEIGSIKEKNKDIVIKIDELGINNGISDQETCSGRGNGEALIESNQNPVGSIDRLVLEGVILVNSVEKRSNCEGTSRLQIKGSEFETSKVMVDTSMKSVCEEKKQSCVIDVRCGNVKDCDGESVCRICHLSSDGLEETKANSSSMELIQLGCGCKGELGVAHIYCAEAWFKLKGNRICEICGEMAKNITGVGDNRFMEEWNERRYVGSSISFPPDGSNGCWRGQPLCNFLMACLVVAFVLPWFFRVKMF